MSAEASFVAAKPRSLLEPGALSLWPRQNVTNQNPVLETKAKEQRGRGSH